MRVDYTWCCQSHILRHLEPAEAEAWSKYTHAIRERNHHHYEGNKRSEESWKVSAIARHREQARILKDVRFSSERLVRYMAREYRTDWTGYLRENSPALERAEERVLVG